MEALRLAEEEERLSGTEETAESGA
jgi:hypothetical protein